MAGIADAGSVIANTSAPASGAGALTAREGPGFRAGRTEGCGDAHANGRTAEIGGG